MYYVECLTFLSIHQALKAAAQPQGFVQVSEIRLLLTSTITLFKQLCTEEPNIKF